MIYPINDIFEGVGDLLVIHGVVELRIFDNDQQQENVYITYGGYHYMAIYIAGDLHSIKRMRKDVNVNGQDQG